MAFTQKTPVLIYYTYIYIFKKYKTLSVLIYSYMNTSGNWKNEKFNRTFTQRFEDMNFIFSW